MHARKIDVITGHSKANVHQNGKAHVLRHLNRMGLSVALARRGEPFHIQVTSTDKDTIATLVVSARTGRAHGGWVMNKRHEDISSPRCFYALVDFEVDPPVTYIVPSEVVADWLKKDHARWLREGPAHKDNPVRKLGNGSWLDVYREAWAPIH